jgi:hypothetical protein
MREETGDAVLLGGKFLFDDLHSVILVACKLFPDT